MTVLSFLLLEKSQWNLMDSCLNPYSCRRFLVISYFLSTPVTPTLLPSFTVTTATPPEHRAEERKEGKHKLAQTIPDIQVTVAHQ